MLTCQKDKFTLPEDILYLNNAYMSPLLKSAQVDGLEALMKKSNPAQYQASDFFTTVSKLKASFGKLIHAPAKQIAVIPSASYGINTVTKNLKPKQGGEVILIEEQFPSNFYPWQSFAKDHGQQLITIKTDTSTSQTKDLNKKILEKIGTNTTAVALGNVHWKDGTLYDLKLIREKTKQFDAALVIDGSQSVGALPLYIDEIAVDALVTVGYKWLLGHYGLGLAYFSPDFNHGKPIEENWINKKDSHQFQNLVNYTDHYEPGAARYSMGGQSSFILVDILLSALQQIEAWGIENIQAYCKKLHERLVENLKDSPLKLNHPRDSASHLLGIQLGNHIDPKMVKEVLAQHNIYTSLRGDSLRISFYLYNDNQDVDKLSEVLLNEL